MTSKKMKLAQELLQLLSQIRRVHWQSVAHQEIRRSEFRLLVTLLHSDASSLKVSELSSEMQITPAAVTHLINSLEKAGYVERLSDLSDRRVVLVGLTDEGRHKIEILKAHFLEALTGLINDLGENDSRKLLRLLNKSLIYLKGQAKGI
jgi:DNA-binding MarR family transcriptional regulator